MAARGESEGGRSADESEIEIPRRSAGRGVAVALVLLLDAGLVVSGGVMIRDHFARAGAAEQKKPDTDTGTGTGTGTFTETGTDTGTGGAGRDGGASSVSVPLPLPQPGPVAVSDAQVQKKPAPVAKPAPPARLPDRKEPAQLPNRLVDAGIIGSPIGRADAAPLFPAGEPDAAPSEPDAAEPEVADAAVEEIDARVSPPGPDPWVESMTRGIRDVVESHREMIEDCYRRAAKEWTSGEPLAGRLDVHLKIVASGDAEDVRVVENRTGSEALGSCLVTVMSTWRYPAPGNEAMEFIWPFNFKSAMPQ